MKVIGTILVLFTLSGCYATRAVSAKPAVLAPVEQRQWFTVAGFIPLSDPAGRECSNGLAKVDSRMSGTDVAINVGLAIAGSIAGTSMCRADGSATAYSACVSSYSTLVPFLFSSRTVEYTCAQ